MGSLRQHIHHKLGNMWPFRPALRHFTSPWKSVDSAGTMFEQTWIFVQVDFLKGRSTCHHCGLLYLPCPLLVLLLLGSQKGGLGPALPLRKPSVCKDRVGQGG